MSRVSLYQSLFAFSDDEAEGPDDCSNEESDDDDMDYRRLCKGLSLSIAYAANTGGIATLTGTPPNMVFSGQAKL